MATKSTLADAVAKARRKQAAIDDIVDAENALHAKREAFLRHHGWDCSSEYPDHCWRWSKVAGGKRITETVTGAIRVEGYLP